MREVAVVFPGQGSQRVGMARDFFDTYAESREIFETASEITQMNMQKLCFDEDASLTHTEHVQPALMTAEIAMLVVLEKELGMKPTYFAGHSMGEYTALVAAGVITFKDGLRIVKSRSSLMEHVAPVGSGAMVALILKDLEETAYQELVHEAGAEVANFNSPHQVVISGTVNAIELACTSLQNKYPAMRIIRINVNMAFHSSMMKNVEPAFEEFLRSFEANMRPERSIHVLSNYLGGFHKRESLIANLVHQISSSVQWRQNMEALRALNVDIYEVGPTRVLARFFNEISLTAKAVFNLRSLHRSLVTTVPTAE